MARFKLMGYQVQGQDDNERAVSLDEQRSEQKSVVVYETDDNVEARAIMNAGGFFRDRDNFITVTSIVDSTLTADSSGPDRSDNPFFRPATFPQKGN